jgi:ribosomal protein L32
MQELEPYGAASSHNIGWSRSRKVMRLRQLQLRSSVQQKKTCFKISRPHYVYAAPGSDFGLKF